MYLKACLLFDCMARWFSSRHWTCWHPVSWQGWILTLLYVVIVLLIFLRVDIDSHSASDTIMGMTLPFILVSLIFVMICKSTSGK